MDVDRRMGERTRRDRRPAEAALRQVREDGPVRDRRRSDQGRAMGERIFLNNCAPCHGSDARGARGFPNLTDKRLALRRRAGDDRHVDHRRAHGRHAGAGSCARRGRREKRRRLRALAVGPRARQISRRSSASRCSSRTAPRATAWTARATRPSARRTSPTRSGSTAARKRRSPRASTRAATSTSTPSTRRCRASRTSSSRRRSISSARTSGACRTSPAPGDGRLALRAWRFPWPQRASLAGASQARRIALCDRTPLAPFSLP